MILIDTRVWRRHLRSGDPRLVAILGERRAATHVEVVEELILGGVSAQIRQSLLRLPRVPAVPASDVIAGIDRHRLAQRGLGAVDVHLFLAAFTAGIALYTADAALASAFAPFQPPGWEG